jgi:hypothetical protein
MGDTCSTLEGADKCTQILIGKSEGKRPLGKPKHGRENNNEVVFCETGYEDLKWIHLTQGRHQWQILEGTMTNLMVQLNIIP